MPKNQGKSHSFLVLKGRQNWKTYTFFSKELFLQVFPGHKKSNFDNSAAIFLLKSNLFSLIVQKISQKIYKSFRKTVFVQMFLWTLQCSFDTPVVLSFVAVNFFFCSNFKKTSKVYPLQQNYFYYFSSECFLDTRIAILATPPKQIAKLQTFSHSEFQTGRRKFIVSKNYCRWEWFTWRMECSIDGMSEIFDDFRFLLAQISKTRRKL